LAGVSNAMGLHKTTLRNASRRTEVRAVIHDLLSLDDLFDAEEQWSLTRIQILRRLSSVSIDRANWPQSIHWSWAYKAASLDTSRLAERGDVRLFGIEADGQWQGLLCGISQGHFARSEAPRSLLVYVDFLEIAPWNWDMPEIARAGRYRGVGLQLMELSVRWSLGLGYGGRVGLHALPQAEWFYRDRCGMKNLGPDPVYHDLCYFELSKSNASEFINRKA
jgi:hypothetical protein